MSKEDTKMGLTLINYQNEKSDGHNIDIVFVHGLNGTSHGTWTRGDCFWPRDLLPNVMPFDCYPRIMTFGYNANLLRRLVKGSIGTFSRELLDQLCERRKNVRNKRPIVFISHSMGGLVVKNCLVVSKLLTDEMYEIYQQTKAIVFFGTPHNGSGLASIGTGLSRLWSSITLAPHQEGIQQLRIKSMSRQMISDNFRTCKFEGTVLSFVETKYTHGIEVVDEKSSILGSNNEKIVGLQAAHGDMVRFKSPLDPMWEPVNTELSQLLRKFDTGCLLGWNLGVFNTAILVQRDFFGRETLLDDAMGYICPDNSRKSHILHLQGSRRGVGASQLAARLCNMIHDDPDPKYSAILWLDAEDEVKFRESCTKLVEKFQLPYEKGGDQHAAECATIKAWLQKAAELQRSRRQYSWLIVFDNISESHFLKRVLPSTLDVGFVILTTRLEYSSDLKRFFDFSATKLLKVNPPTDVEIINFFSTHLRLDQTRGKHDRISEQIGIIAKICNYDYQPMLSAASLLSKSRISLSSPLLGSHIKSLLENHPIKQTNNPNMSTEAAGMVGGVTLLLLGTMSCLSGVPVTHEFFSPDFTKRDLVDRSSVSMHTRNIQGKELQDLQKFVEAREQLKRLNLIEEAYSNAVSNLETPLIFAINCLYYQSPTQSNGDTLGPKWNDAKRWIPHLNAILTTLEKIDCRKPNATLVKTQYLLLDTLSSFIWGLKQEERYVEAEYLAHKGLELWNNLIPNKDFLKRSKDDPMWLQTGIEPTSLLLNRSDIVSHLATIAIERNNPKDAIKYMVEVRVLRECAKQLDVEKGTQDHPGWDNLTNANLAVAYLIDKQFEKAVTTLRLEHASTLTSPKAKRIGNLALCYLMKGDKEQAWELNKSAWERERDGRERGRLCFNRALFYLLSRDLAKARAVLKECVNIREKAEEIPSIIGFTYHKLGLLAVDQGYFEEACHSFREAVRLLRPACITHTPTRLPGLPPDADQTLLSPLPPTFLLRSLFALTSALAKTPAGDSAIVKAENDILDYIDSQRAFFSSTQVHVVGEDDETRPCTIDSLKVEELRTVFLSQEVNEWVGIQYR